jgi:hypothetical protein
VGDKKAILIALLRHNYSAITKRKRRILNKARVGQSKMANVEEQHKLSQEQIDFFLENGWLKLSDCFTREQAEGLQENLWTRLGMDPEDKSTW